MGQYDKLKSDVYDVAIACKNEGLVVWSAGNMSACDRENGVLAITPGGLSYEKMTLEDIVVIDFSGNVIEGSHRPSSEWQMHVSLYNQLPQIGGVVHTHSPYLTCFSILNESVPVVLAEMTFAINGDIPFCTYQKPGSVELGLKAAEVLMERNVCILNNHGMVSVGKDAREAHKRAVYAEDAAREYYLARSIGNPIPLE